MIVSSTSIGGTILPVGNIAISSGGSKSFNITPNIGYLISDVKINDVSKAVISNYTFVNVTANQTISVSFRKK